MNDVFPIPNCRVVQVTQADPADICVAAQGVQPGAACPSCSMISQAVHSRYHRRPADLPSLGQAVRLDLCVRRFYCRNTGCVRRTFVEPLPDLLAPRARRTRRLATAQGQMGVACGGEAGARLLRGLAMPVSGDTVLRLVRAMPLPEIGAIQALGVDDWALKKGQTYGTILIDLIGRRAVDLLPDRTASSLEAWLQGRPTILVIARDRSPEYARGAAKGAPGAIQVADRWHLLANLREMIARWLSGIHGRLRRLPAVPGMVSPARRTRACRRSRAEAAATADYRARRLAVYEEVRRRFGAGEKLLAISRALGLARGTVRRYAYAERFPERAVRVPPPGILDPWLEHLEARVALHGPGCRTDPSVRCRSRAAGAPATRVAAGPGSASS